MIHISRDNKKEASVGKTEPNETNALGEKTPRKLTQDDFQSYQVLCSFAACLLAESPPEDFINQLIEQRAYLKEPPFSTVAQTSAEELYEFLGEGVLAVRGLSAEKAQDREKRAQETSTDAIPLEGMPEKLECKQKASSKEGALLFQSIHQDYTYLFYMVGVSHTSPYESVYRTDDKTLFGPTTLEVREAYHASGIKIEREGSTPDDHIGYELSFLAHLLALGSKALEKSDLNEQRRIAESIRAFLSEHVLVFAPIYLKSVQTQAQTPFYRALARITLRTIESMAEAFGTLAVETIEESAYLLEK